MRVLYLKKSSEARIAELTLSRSTNYIVERHTSNKKSQEAVCSSSVFLDVKEILTTPYMHIGLLLIKRSANVPCLHKHRIMHMNVLNPLTLLAHNIHIWVVAHIRSARSFLNRLTRELVSERTCIRLELSYT